MKNKKEQQLINENIKAFKVCVISEEGENLGVMSRDKALSLATEKNLDLVMLSDKDDVPMVKIMDFGKSLYVKKKKMSEGKKKQKVIKIKEIKMRPTIGQHDYQTKINQGVKFLQAGNKLKVTLMFRRGRESETRQVTGVNFFQQIDQTLQEHGLKNIAHERDMHAGPFWSRVYFLKPSK